MRGGEPGWYWLASRSEIGVAIGATTPITATLDYDNNGLVTRAGLPNGVEQRTQYDGAGRLARMTTLNTANAGALNSTYTYGYNAAGWMASIGSTVGGSSDGRTLVHDALGRLTKDLLTSTGLGKVYAYTGDGDIALDRNGCLTACPINGDIVYDYSATSPHELADMHTALSSKALATFGYDGAGNTVSITGTSYRDYTSGVDTHLSYDAAGLLTGATLADGTSVAMGYNALGQRASYSVTPAGGGAATYSAHFQYRRAELAQVTVAGVSNYVDTYVYQQNSAPLELLRQVGGATSRYYYVLDGQGNVVALTDSSGAVVDRYAYDQWGSLTDISESVPQRLRYRGYWLDQELGWYWLSVREYDPALHRFLQPDPSEQEGLFSYAYAGDNPADLADPSGLASAPQSSTTVGAGTQLQNADAVGSALYLEDLGEGAVPIAGVDGIISPIGLPLLLGCSIGPINWCAKAAEYVVDLGNGLRLVCVRSGACHLAQLLCNATVCEDIEVLTSNASLLRKLAAGGDLVLWIPGLDEFKVIELGAKGLAAVARGDRAVQAGRAVEGARFLGGCAHCFPAGTVVATPDGERPIESLHVGDTVLAEDPATGAVAAEPVQALIQDPVSDVLELRLSDGSTIRTTPNHPFWVDGNADFADAGWRAAGELRAGDRLRSAGNGIVEVVGLRYHVARAEVYTLTVAGLHTFFVGNARVLVHNAKGGGGDRGRSGQAKRNESRQVEDAARAAGLKGDQVHDFGRYIEVLKDDVSKRNDANFSYSDLLTLAKDFLKNGCQW